MTNRSQLWTGTAQKAVYDSNPMMNGQMNMTVGSVSTPHGGEPNTSSDPFAKYIPFFVKITTVHINNYAFTLVAYNHFFIFYILL